jgi:hypothetical protein
MPLGKYKTEIIGVSAEVGVGDAFGVTINNQYRIRSDTEIAKRVEALAPIAFALGQIPTPVEHIAEEQNPVDFLLEGRKTLSVKTNMSRLGKVAPQVVGQPTAKTFWEHFDDLMDIPLPSKREEQRLEFKRTSISKIADFMNRYWDNLFECDHMVYFYNFVDNKGQLVEQPGFKSLARFDSPKWNPDDFSLSWEKHWRVSNSQQPRLSKVQIQYGFGRFPHRLWVGLGLLKTSFLPRIVQLHLALPQLSRKTLGQPQQECSFDLMSSPPPRWIQNPRTDPKSYLPASRASV